MKKKLPGWAVLLIITLAAGLALGGTNALTKDPIAEQTRIAAEKARKAALPDADAFEELELAEGASVDWAYAGLKDGNAVGYVAQKTVNGFGGKVEVIAGVNTQNAPDFTIGGISVGGANFSETAGLGARALFGEPGQIRSGTHRESRPLSRKQPRYLPVEDFRSCQIRPVWSLLKGSTARRVDQVLQFRP